MAWPYGRMAWHVGRAISNESAATAAAAAVDAAMKYGDEATKKDTLLRHWVKLLCNTPVRPVDVDKLLSSQLASKHAIELVAALKGSTLMWAI